MIIDGNPLDYSYQWSSNTSSGTSNGIGTGWTDLSAGIYTVTITFPLVPDCHLVKTIGIGNIDGPQIEDIQITPATCNAADGTVTLLPCLLYTSPSPRD